MKYPTCSLLGLPMSGGVLADIYLGKCLIGSVFKNNVAIK